jgi:hypothetical protein
VIFMANLCINDFTIYAKVRTIRQFLSECTEPDEREPEGKRLSFALILNMPDGEFTKLSRHAALEILGCNSVFSNACFATDIDDENDPDEFFRYEISGSTGWSPPTGIAAAIAARYRCGVVLRFDEPMMCIRGEYACHYNPDYKEPDHQVLGCGGVVPKKPGSDEEPVLGGKVIVDYFEQYSSPPDYAAMNLPG